MAKIGSLIADLGMDTASFESGIKKAETGLKRFSRKSERAFQNLNRKAGMFATALGTAATVGFGALIKNALDTADQMEKLNRRLGISTEALSQMKFAAEQSGIGFNTLTMAMQRSQRRIAEAAQGTGEAKDALIELGLSAQALNNLTPDQQLIAISEAMQQLENSGDRTRLAMKLFDSEGVALTQIMGDGAKGIQELMIEADALGLTLNNKTAVGAAAANDAINRAKSAMQGAALQATQNLAPAIENLANDFSVMIPTAVNNAVSSFYTFRQNAIQVLAFLVRKWADFAQFIGEITGADTASKQIRQNLKLIEDLQTRSLEKMNGRQKRAHQERLNRLKEETEALQLGDTFGQQMLKNAEFAAMFEEALLGSADQAQALVERLKSAGNAVGEMAKNPPTETTEEINRMSEGLLKAKAEARKLGETLSVDLFDNTKSAFDQIIEQWKQTLMSIVNEWISSGIRDLFGSIFNSGSPGGFLSSLGSLFGFDGKASGGPVTSGRPYIVGERGPELFTPSTNGTIVPNHQMGGGMGSVVFQNSYDFSGSTLNEAEVREMIADSQRITARQIQDAKNRGRF